MTVATKLRLASGVVIAVLVAILAVALYVPTRLNSSANEKYGTQAIPFQRDVQGLLRQKVEQKAAADRYSLTRDEASRQHYINAEANVNFRLTRLTF
jgi:ABC-type transporter lipoprotein component MlaA